MAKTLETHHQLLWTNKIPKYSEWGIMAILLLKLPAVGKHQKLQVGAYIILLADLNKLRSKEAALRSADSPERDENALIYMC